MVTGHDNAAVWHPTQEMRANSLMAKFIEWLNQSNVGNFSADDYMSLHHWSITDPEVFWQSIWDFFQLKSHTPAKAILSSKQMPGAKWFDGMQLNFAENLLRQAKGERGSNEAVVAISETTEPRRYSFDKLYEDVGALEYYLKANGVTAGDRVAGIVTNGYEALAGMLAATSMGAIWTSASPDFGAGSILDRFGQIEPAALIVVNGYGYGGKTFRRQAEFKKVISGLKSLRCVVNVQQLPDEPPLGGDLVTDWDQALANGRGKEPSFTPLPSDHPVYILYSSGTTGKPKCIVHSAAGLLVNHAKELMLHGDIRPQDRLLYYTTCGWMMWNWQASALMAGATLITVDGSPGYPDIGMLWELVESESVTHFGTSARFLAGCRKAELRPFNKLGLEKLRIVFSTGSPLLPEDYDWFYENPENKVLLGSIAGGTDICGCFVGTTPILPVHRGEIQCRMLGVDVVAMDDEGNVLQNTAGEFVCRQPLPSMPLMFWNDESGDRYHSAYFDTYPGLWAHGDFVRFTEQGGAVIYGRSDATLNPGGVRIGTAEIYRQVETEESIADSLVIGRQSDGDVEVVLLVKLSEGASLDDELKQKLRSQIKTGASPRHVPRHIIAVDDIPYTQSGKKVEIAINRMINNQPYTGNLNALSNPESLESIRARLVKEGLLS